MPRQRRYKPNADKLLAERQEASIVAAGEGYPPQVCAWAAGVGLAEMMEWVRGDVGFSSRYYQARATAYGRAVYQVRYHLNSDDDRLRFRAAQELLREFRRVEVDPVVQEEDIGAMIRAREFTEAVAGAVAEYGQLPLALGGGEEANDAGNGSS